MAVVPSSWPAKTGHPRLYYLSAIPPKSTPHAGVSLSSFDVASGEVGGHEVVMVCHTFQHSL